MSVNWNDPIEAVHEDGRTAPVVLESGPNVLGNYWIRSGDEPDDCGLLFKQDGTSGGCSYPNWRIRNVQPAAAKPAEIDAALVDRMVALVRQLAGKPLEGQLLHDVHVEARAIVAKLPEPVDPDEREAKNIEHAYAGGNNREYRMVLAAIKRGRALEREAK